MTLPGQGRGQENTALLNACGRSLFSLPVEDPDWTFGFGLDFCLLVFSLFVSPSVPPSLPHFFLISITSFPFPACLSLHSTRKEVFG